METRKKKTKNSYTFDSTEFVNYTPHSIDIFDSLTRQKLISFPPSGKELRLSEKLVKESGEVFFIEKGETPEKEQKIVTFYVHKPPSYGGIVIFPEKDQDNSKIINQIEKTNIIVSEKVACYLLNNPEMIRQRFIPNTHVFSPNTGLSGVIRDSDGRIIGTSSLYLWI